MRRWPVFTPVLSSLLERRLTAWVLVLGVAAQVGLVAMGLPGWSCPFRSVFGIPCPGCGLTTAVTLLMRGEWRTALSLHAFSPLVLLTGGLMIGIGVLPPTIHREAVAWISGMERKTGVTTVLLFGLLGYWILRGWGFMSP